jgi:hypothetical protein
MKIVSVNVDMPREVIWKGMRVQTAIFKEPLDGAVTIVFVLTRGQIDGVTEMAAYSNRAIRFITRDKALFVE